MHKVVQSSKYLIELISYWSLYCKLEANSANQYCANLISQQNMKGKYVFNFSNINTRLMY